MAIDSTTITVPKCLIGNRNSKIYAFCGRCCKTELDCRRESYIFRVKYPINRKAPTVMVRAFSVLIVLNLSRYHKSLNIYFARTGSHTNLVNTRSKRSHVCI